MEATWRLNNRGEGWICHADYSEVEGGLNKLEVKERFFILREAEGERWRLYMEKCSYKVE